MQDVIYGSPELRASMPFLGGINPADVVNVRQGAHPRSLKAKSIIESARRNPRLAGLFTEDQLPEELRGPACQ